MDFEILVGDEQDSQFKEIQLDEKEKVAAKLYFNGVNDLDEEVNHTFFKVDNHKIHSMNFFAAKIYVSQEDNETVLILGNKLGVDKVIYHVGGEHDQDESFACKFGNLWIFRGEDLYERFQRKIEDNPQEYVIS